LQFIRRKCREWNKNSIAAKNKTKHDLISQLQHYELVQEDHILNDLELESFQACHSNLQKNLDDEESYWQQREHLK
jgi:hypothetical protein